MPFYKLAGFFRHSLRARAPRDAAHRGTAPPGCCVGLVANSEETPTSDGGLCGRRDRGPSLLNSSRRTSFNHSSSNNYNTTVEVEAMVLMSGETTRRTASLSTPARCRRAGRGNSKQGLRAAAASCPNNNRLVVVVVVM